jgi:PAS domain S-box-containing protein
MNKNMKVLVVDDNKDGRLLLSKLLTSNNYEVNEACNGAEALEFLKASKPDLIISDILMPEMDGFTLIRELNKDITGGKIPVVLYSAQYVNEKDKELAKKLGASRFITKPAEPKEILKEIKTVLAEFESAEQKHMKSPLTKDEEYLSEYAERVFRKLEDKVKELEQEITERKEAEEALKLSEEKYRDLFENANDAICIVDADLKFEDINTKTVELTGYSKEELLKMRIFELIPPEQASRSKDEFKKLREKGQYEKFIGKMVTKSGNMIDVEVNSSAIIEDGRIIGSRDIIRDITERKKAEIAIQVSEARLKEAQRVAHIGNWEWKPKTNELYWSDENYRIFGLNPDISPSLNTFFNIIHPDDLESVKKNIDDARTYAFECR